MPKKLIITEKPSVAMEYAKVLKISANRKNGYIESDNWIITWCVGHLVTMSYPEVYDEKLKYWRLDTLPFIPTEWKYEIIPAVQNQFNIVKSLLQREDVKSNTPANTLGYKITVRATDTNSKVTKDATITIIVDKKSVTKPTSPADKVYNAEEQNHGITVSEGTSIVTNGSTLKATNVGTYNVIFTLNSNYKWNDGTTSNITIQWKITAYNKQCYNRKHK